MNFVFIEQVNVVAALGVWATCWVEKKVN